MKELLKKLLDERCKVLETADLTAEQTINLLKEVKLILDIKKEIKTNNNLFH